MGSLKAVYKGNQEQQKLKELCHTYENLVEDTTRAQNRLKVIYRGRGIDCSGTKVYHPDRRAEYLAKLSDEAARFRCCELADSCCLTSSASRAGLQSIPADRAATVGALRYSFQALIGSWLVIKVEASDLVKLALFLRIDSHFNSTRLAPFLSLMQSPLRKG